MRRVLIVLGTLGVTVVGFAGPASAHVTRPVDASHYRSRITVIVPSSAPFTARVARNGDWIEITSRSSAPLIVRGYFYEPYLRIGPDEVDVNSQAPTAYLNGGLLGALGPTLLNGSAAPPRWSRVRKGRTAHWHDLRLQWVGGGRPPDVARDPGHNHVIADWHLYVDSGSQSAIITGQLSWTALKPVSSWGIIVTVTDGVFLLVAVLWIVVRLRRDGRGAFAAESMTMAPSRNL